AAKPTITWPGRARSAEISARTSGFRTRTMGSGSCPSFFLIFPAAYTAGRKSATAAAITTASASGAASCTASRRWARPAHLDARPDLDNVHAPRVGQAGVRGDQRDPGTPRHGRTGEGVALLARGS